MQSTTIVNGVKLSYSLFKSQKGDSSIPLILIMGWTGVKEDWGDLPLHLSKNRDVLIFDNRGIGQSDVTDGPYSMELFCQDILSLLDFIGWKIVHVFGISMGGMIALNLAISAPSRIAKLILGCTSAGGRESTLPLPHVTQRLLPSPNETREQAVRRMMSVNFSAKWIKENQKKYEEEIENSLKYVRRLKGILAQYEAIKKHRVVDKLHQITKPTLVIHGDEDELIPFENGKMLAKNIKGAKMVVIKEAAHLFFRTHLEESVKAVDDFLLEKSKL